MTEGFSLKHQGYVSAPLREWGGNNGEYTEDYTMYAPKKDHGEGLQHLREGNDEQHLS